MRKILFLTVIALVSLTACGQNRSNRTNADESASVHMTAQIDQADVVNVYYFHGKQRCKTCIAVGDVSEKTIKDAYANNPNVKFTEVKTHEEQNKALVEKYQATTALRSHNRRSLMLSTAPKNLPTLSKPR